MTEQLLFVTSQPLNVQTASRRTCSALDVWRMRYDQILVKGTAGALGNWATRYPERRRSVEHQVGTACRCPRGCIFRYKCSGNQLGAAMYRATIGNRRYAFPDLKTLMARASPLRSGDVLAGVAAETGEERVAAQFALADLPLATFLDDQVVPYEIDEVTRLIIDTHDRRAFAPIASLTVGGFR